MELSFWDLCWPLASLGLGFPSFTVGWAPWCLQLYVHACPPTLSLAQLVPLARPSTNPSFLGFSSCSWPSKGAAHCSVSLSSSPVLCRGPRASRVCLSQLVWAGPGGGPEHMACTPPAGLLLCAGLGSIYFPCFFLLMKNKYAGQPGSKQQEECWFVVAAAESLPPLPTTLVPSGAALGRGPGRPDPPHRLGLRRLGPCPPPSL